MSKTLDILLLFCYLKNVKSILHFVLQKGENHMTIGAMIFLGVIFIVFIALDVIMLVSLSRPGDERNQIIVWKASTFTLLGTAGAKMLDIIENLVRSQPMTANPFIELEVAAIIYFAALMYYRRKHGG